MTLAFDSRLAAAGGLIRTTRLRELGYSRGRIARLVAAGRAWRPRRGWVAGPTAPADAVRAVQLGGRLGGASALASFRIWVDDDPGLVVACAPTASRLPATRSGERRVWVADRFPVDSACQWRVSVLDALLQFALDAPYDSLVASLDSALNQHLITTRDFERLIAALPLRLRSIRRDVDGSAMSGTETKMRLELVRAGYKVRSQVSIPGIGDVDLLVDDWLIVELDSRGHHQAPKQQTIDRKRDGNAVLVGYGHERFMWSQVRYSMDWCLDVVATRLRDGRPSSNALNRSAAVG